jgi:transposase
MQPKQPSAAQPSAGKIEALRQSGTLNRRPANVQASLFLEERFFDPQDLTQVKYEMLRHVRNEARPISRAAATFGLSRPAFYKAQEDFTRDGLAGLLPKRRGPKTRHKLTPEILARAAQMRAQQPPVPTPELLRHIQDTFGIQVHRRSLERALAPAKKKRGT